MSWYSADWLTRKIVTIDNTKVGATQTNFTVKVEVTDNDLKNNARVDGFDIIFTDTSETLLAFEIEKWDYTTGELIAWVKVPSVDGSTDTDFHMYYKNANQTTTLTTNAWDENHVAVYHLNEGDTTVNAVINDSVIHYEGVIPFFS